MTTETQSIQINIKVPEGYNLIGYRQPVLNDLWLDEGRQAVHLMGYHSWSHFKPIVEKVETKEITLEGLTLSIPQAEMLYVLMNCEPRRLENVLDELMYDAEQTEDIAIRMTDDNDLTAKAIRDTFIAQNMHNQLMGV